MAGKISTLDYPTSLQRYAVTDAEYLRSHPEYDVLCVGVVVFNKEGKLLLVQRAATDAFPNMWVSRLWR
jgi:isopentenyldiphosphate isomerase